MNASATVFIVDDDPGVRSAAGAVLESAGFKIEAFASAAEFLATYDAERPGCLLLDLQMPGIDGLELQRRLVSLGSQLPIIFLTAHGEVSAAVRALQSGAIDFLEKPVQGSALLDRVRQAIEIDADRRRKRAHEVERAAKMARLTPREKEILPILLEGLPSKAIAARLGISPKTVDIHRANIMKKTGAESLIGLAAMMNPKMVRERTKG